MSAPNLQEAPFRRTDIISLDGFELRSSYPEAAPYDERYLVDVLEQTDWALEGMAHALVACQELVAQEGGQLSVTEAGRKFSVSARARAKYLKGEKHAYVAPAGGSMHNAGAAVDWWVYKLHFKGIPRDKWLEHLWDIVIPQGFTPIIKVPSLKQSECWHFDWRGPWQSTYDWFKQHKPSVAYDRMARCAILDAGAWDFEFDTERSQEWMKVAYLQAQLHRIGYHEVGDVDGIMGRKTRSTLEAAAVNSLGVEYGPWFGDFEGAAEILNKVGPHLLKTLAEVR